ncbi:MAG: hypothetical protein V1707_01080, partial [bacterium]
MGKMIKRVPDNTDCGTEVLGLLADLVTQLNNGAKTKQQLGLFNQGKNPFFDKPAQPVSLKTAKRIFGAGLLGPQAVRRTFGVKLEDVPPINASIQELERASELGQRLMLRIPKVNASLLSMIGISNLLQPRFDEQSKGKILYDTGGWKATEDFFIKDTPRFGWALVSSKVLPGSVGKNYLDQTQLLIDYLVKRVFCNIMFQPYVDAITEFQNAFKDKPTEELEKFLKDDWQKAAQVLSDLRINQLLRHTPTEVLYDFVLVSDNLNERLWENLYTWTNRRSS